jgi:hypothetical protein
MTLDRLWQLDSTNAASNSNYGGAAISENCAPSGINNALRALGVMVTRELAFQAAAISASVSTNLVTASTGLLVPVTGPNAIASFGVVPGEQPNAAVLRIVQFSSSASLSNGTALRLIGGTSRRTQPGDIGGYVHVGSADVWHEFLWSPIDGGVAGSNSLSVTTITNRSLSTSAISTVTLNAASASITAIGITALSSLNSISASVGEFTLLSASGRPAIVFHGRVVNSTYTTCGTDLPVDDSIPAITEGNEVMSLTVTPTNAASLLRIRANLAVGVSTTGNAGAGLWVDATSAALIAEGQRVEGSTDVRRFVIDHFVSASNTTQRVYHVRIGPDTGVTNAFLNGSGGGRYFGGVMSSTLSVEEILPG